MSTAATEREPSYSLAKPQKGIPALRGHNDITLYLLQNKNDVTMPISTNIFFGTVMQSIGPKNTQR